MTTGDEVTTYEVMDDEERTQDAAAAIQHLSREVQTLAELRSRHRIALAVLTAGGSDATRLARLALEGAPIDELILKATSAPEGGR